MLDKRLGEINYCAYLSIMETGFIVEMKCNNGGGFRYFTRNEEKKHRTTADRSQAEVMSKSDAEFQLLLWAMEYRHYTLRVTNE